MTMQDGLPTSVVTWRPVFGATAAVVPELPFEVGDDAASGHEASITRSSDGFCSRVIWYALGSYIDDGICQTSGHTLPT